MEKHIVGFGDTGNKVIDSLLRRIEEGFLPKDEVILTAIKGKHERTRAFNRQYNESYMTVRDKLPKLIDFGIKKEGKADVVNEYLNKLEAVKREVMNPSFLILGKEVKEASCSAEALADLMYRKRVSSDEFHQVVSGLARWQVLDEIQRQLQPKNFYSCFASFVEPPKHSGRPVEDLYENVDKGKLRDTLEALHREKYSMTVTEGWKVARNDTRHFLLAFMLSLFESPLTMLGGKMAAFYRFFKDVCGYAFIPVKETLGNWYKAYCKFVYKRERQPMYEPKGVCERRLLSVEEMVAWMHGRFPQYQLCPV